MKRLVCRLRNLVDKHGPSILFYVVLLNAFLLGWIYVDGNTQADKRQDAAIAESKRQTQEITAALKKHTELLNSNDQQLREQGEATLCILAILSPHAVPNADPEKCRSKIANATSAGSSFVTVREVQTAESVSNTNQSAQQVPQNQETPSGPLLDQILNSINLLE